MVTSVENLAAEVRQAFAERLYPGDEHVSLSRPDCPGYEGESVGRFFRGKDWRRLTSESLLNNQELDRNAFMFFMSVEGFVYYLPAFLILSLDVDGAFALGESLAFKLTPPGEQAPSAWREHFSRILASLSPGEAGAVARVLQYLSQEHQRLDCVPNQPQAALDGYWGQLLN